MTKTVVPLAAPPENGPVVAIGRDASSAEFPSDAGGDEVRRWLEPVAQWGAAHYVTNARVQIGVVIHRGIALPLTVSNADAADDTHAADAADAADDSYVVSPFTHYIRYLEEELRLVHPRPLRLALWVLIRAIAVILGRRALDRVVIVNNWLLSTNLYPAGVAAHAPAIGRELIRRYPGHAVMFRSLNSTSNGDLIAALQDVGFRALTSRRVYLLDARDPRRFRHRDLIRDMALLERTPYRIEPITEPSAAEVQRILELYRLLYLEKYSPLNPQFTPEFIARAIQTRFLTVYGLTRAGRLDGVLGYFVRNGVMTTPLFGYDTALPRKLGLYRMLSALLCVRARELGVLLNESSGAATFKRQRGAEPVIEFSLVATAHLSPYPRFAWWLLRLLVNRVGTPLLARYDR
jgi:hypothetical protein